MEIGIYEKTGEFYSVLDFTKKSVDWNKLEGMARKADLINVMSLYDKK